MVGLAPQCGLRGVEGKKRPPVTRGFGGRYWVRNRIGYNLLTWGNAV